MKRLRGRDYLLISSYSFGLNALWNSMHSIILPAVLLQFVPYALKGTALGALTFIGLLLAIFLQPVTGALSDVIRSPWGRRRPWIMVGAAGSIVSLLIFGLARSFIVLALGYLLLQVTSNIAHGPYQGLIPDLAPRRRHGVASGVRNLLDIAGLLAGLSIAGFAMDRGRPAWALAAIVAILAGVAITTWLGVREEPAEASADARPALARARAALADAFRFDYQRHADYAWLLLSRFLVLGGIYAMQGFAQYYLRDVLGVARPASMTARLANIIGLATILLVYPAGYLSDRFGRKWANTLAALLCSVGVFLFLLMRSYAGLLAAGALVGVGLGAFLSCNWALATDLAPAESAGKYLGLSNLATAGAAAVARLGGPLIDLFNHLEPGRGYMIMLLVAGLSILAGAVVMRYKVHEPTGASRRASLPITAIWSRLWRRYRRAVQRMSGGAYDAVRPDDREPSD
jgi:Na+/melibiose symporter-like transporter